VIQIPATTAGIVLEDGVQVTFSTDPAGGSFRVADHWAFAARTADASVEGLVEAPPRAIHHHYCRLAIVEFPDTVIDCRTLWPPEFEGGEGGCDCSVCVSAESHNSGQLTIQAALDQVRGTGGTVCLGPGLYQLRASLSISGARSVRLHGQGWTTVLLYLGAGPAMNVLGSVGIRIEDMTVVTSAVGPERETTGAPATTVGMGIAIRNSIGLTVERCVIVQVGRVIGGMTGTTAPVGVGPVGVLAGFLGSGGPAIALSGFVVQTRIRENVLIAGAGVLAVTSDPYRDRAEAVAAAAAQPLGIVATANLFVEDNLILGARLGISLQGLSLHFAETRISGNLVVLCPDGGIVATGSVLRTALGAFPSHMVVRGNTVRPAGDGIVIGTGDTRIVENDVSGLLAPGDAIALVAGVQRTGIERCQVFANRVTAVQGNGIAIRGPVRSAMLKHNVIQLTGGGIVMHPESSADDLDIEDNQLLDIAVLVREAEQKGEVWAIRVGRAGRARIANNSIARVASQAPQLSARLGIQVVACSSVAVVGNEVIDVGPTEFIGGLDVVDNVVRRTSELAKETDGSAWWAVLVQSAGRAVETPLVIGRLAVIAAEGALFLLTEGRLAQLPPGREIVAVRGNLTEGHGQSPVVEVASLGACVVSDNRCLLVSLRIPAVDVDAMALVAGGNYVQGSPDMPAMRLSVPEGAYTVVGNLTSGRIEMPSSPTGTLELPWANVNTVAI
jgi:hypothetical protein